MKNLHQKKEKLKINNGLNRNMPPSSCKCKSNNIHDRWIEFLEEDNGRLSNIRLMSFVMLLVTISLAVFSIFTPIETEIFLISAASTFVPKVLQKKIENIRLNNNNINNNREIIS